MPSSSGQQRRPYTRFGVYRLVERCAARVPSLAARRITPHTIRHTSACHLLQAGVDLNTIRAWLGHASLDTTNIYAEIDMEMKAKALALCDAAGARAGSPVEGQQGADGLPGGTLSEENYVAETWRLLMLPRDGPGTPPHNPGRNI